MTPSLEEWLTKAKEALSTNEVRLNPLCTNPITIVAVQKALFSTHPTPYCPLADEPCNFSNDGTLR